MAFVLSVFGILIDSTWDLLQIDCFGLGIPIYRVILATGACYASILVLRVLLGIDPAPRTGPGYRSGSGGDKKISDVRKKDTK